MYQGERAPMMNDVIWRGAQPASGSISEPIVETVVRSRLRWRAISRSSAAAHEV